MTTTDENRKQFVHQNGSVPCTVEEKMRRIQERVDRDLMDSFPASDPPGWTLGIERREIECNV